MNANPTIVVEPTQLPSAVATAAPAVDLPPGWKQAVDKHSGEVYYLNESTGDTDPN